MIIDGRTIANHILNDLAARVHILEDKYNVRPHLAVIRVGEDPAITAYINQKGKMSKEIGAILSVYNFPNSVSQDELKNCIDFLQEKGDIHGLILQLPVPDSINSHKLIMDIHPEKDIDGFRPNSQFVIPIAAAVLKLLEIPMIKETQESGESFNEWLRSKKIVVMGKGKTGGQPVIDILKKREANVTVIDSSTTLVKEKTLEADIIITAVGKPEILTPDMIKKDVILIGIGMTMDENDKFVGDYNEESIKTKASWYTPIPGGAGPVNAACLMENLVIATENVLKN